MPHFALRTPGYPLFLAACQALFGERFLPVRLVQAVLGTLGVYLVYRLVDRAVPGRDAAIVAAGLAAVEPYGVGLGALILSEGLFLPLMLAGLWGLAVLWRRGDEPGPRHRAAVAVGTGLVHGAAILVRPSWALIVPLLLAAWVVGAGRGRRREAIRGAAIVALATAAVMAPWWARNARVFGRFVPTALWVGASLYDGLSPTATGASDMEFLERAGIVELDEATQDAELRRRAVDFALSIRAGRWSWPRSRRRGSGAPGRTPRRCGRPPPPWPRRPSRSRCSASSASGLGLSPRRPGAGPAARAARLFLALAYDLRQLDPLPDPRLPAGARAGGGRLAVGVASRTVSGRGSADGAMRTLRETTPREGPMRRRVRKVVGWVLLLLVAVVIGGGWFAYSYVTDSETLRAAIREGAPRFLPGCKVDVQRVQVRPFAGKVVLNVISLRRWERGSPLLVGSSPWVQVSYDPWAMLDGRFDLKEIVVAQPRLQLRRRVDGTWNFLGLLADPWPLPPSETSPPIRIENGTVDWSTRPTGPTRRRRRSSATSR